MLPVDVVNRLWLPRKNNSPLELPATLPKSIVPFSVRPLTMVIFAALPASCTCVPSNVIPAAMVTPPMKLPPKRLIASFEPPLPAIVPPLMVPPHNTQFPKLGDSVSVVPMLFTAACKYTVPAVSLKVPRAAGAIAPTR